MSSPTHSITIAITFTTRARTCNLYGLLSDGSLKVGLTSPLLDNKANTQLCQFIAKTLSLPNSSISLQSGLKSKRKLLKIMNITMEEWNVKLSPFI